MKYFIQNLIQIFTKLNNKYPDQKDTPILICTQEIFSEFLVLKWKNQKLIEIKYKNKHSPNKLHKSKKSL